MVKKNQNLSQRHNLLPRCWPIRWTSAALLLLRCKQGSGRCLRSRFLLKRFLLLKIKLPQKLTSSCSCVPRTTTRVTTTWPRSSSARVDDSRSRRRTPSSNLSCSSRTRCASRTTTESSCVQGQKQLVKNVKQTSQLEIYKNPVGISQLLGLLAGEATLGSRLMWSVFEGWHFLGVLFSRSEVLLNEGGGRTQN